MRWLRDIALLLVLSAIGVAIAWFQFNRRDQSALVDRATAETQRLEREIRFRAATKSGELNNRGWPVTVDPGWFDTDPPCNTLVSNDRPWVEIAPAEQGELQHPPVRMILDDTTPAFWYNPYQGVVRARVPVSVNDDEATALYNRVNQTNLTSIHWCETPANTPKPKADKAVSRMKPLDEPVDDIMGPPAPAKRERQTVVVRRTTPGSKH